MRSGDDAENVASFILPVKRLFDSGRTVTGAIIRVLPQFENILYRRERLDPASMHESG